DIQREFNQEPQVVITYPLLVGMDGIEKMSKSLSNYIGITEEKDIMFAKIMSISDDIMFDYFRLVSTFDISEIEKIEKEVNDLNEYLGLLNQFPILLFCSFLYILYVL
ncbi:unnamed protein product, partial [marine sediment metagenome]